MIVFLDTEFTDFIHPELLSIGLATIDGQEFYAELDQDTEVGRAREKASSDFVRFGGVLDLWRRLPGTTVPLNEIGDRLGTRLKDLLDASPHELLQIAFDYSTDFELMGIALEDAGVWEDLRSRISRVNVFNRTGSRKGQQAAEAHHVASAGDGLGRHHALADARALRAPYLTLTAAAPVQSKGTST